MIMRNVLLRLSVSVLTFVVGFCVHELLVAKPELKGNQPADRVLVQPMQPVGLRTDELVEEAVTVLPSLFDPSGDYHPKAQITEPSEKYIQFVLEVRRRRGKLIAWGHVSKVGGWYKFVSVSVNEEHLKFRTEKVRGVEYRFDGHFLGTGDFSEQFNQITGTPLLEGTLQKYFEGQRVFEVDAVFVHYPGC